MLHDILVKTLNRYYNFLYSELLFTKNHYDEKF
jgi:hypothetical protein